MPCPNCTSPLSKRFHGFLRDRQTCLVCGLTWEAPGTGLTWAAAISAVVLSVAGSVYSEPSNGEQPPS
jgi:uncharacterized protein (DUF983 family)